MKHCGARRGGQGTARGASYGQGRDHPGPRYTSLLHGEHLNDVTIRGDGAGSVLDGQGWYWWPHKKDWKLTRGHLLELMYSRRVTVANNDTSLLLTPLSPFDERRMHQSERD